MPHRVVVTWWVGQYGTIADFVCARAIVVVIRRSMSRGSVRRRLHATLPLSESRSV